MKKENEKGALTVEAMIFLMLFIIAFVSLMNLVNLVRAQVAMQYAVAQTAKEISQYSYILTKTGIVESSNKTYKKAKGFTDDVEAVAEDAVKISSAIGDVGTSGDIVSAAATITEAANSMSETLDEYLENPENLLAGILAVGKNELQESAKSYLVGAIAKNRLKACLEEAGKDPETYLLKLGIVDGLDGLDFRESTWFSNGNQDIYVVVEYKIEIKIMFLTMELSGFKVCGATRIW